MRSFGRYLWAAPASLVGLLLASPLWLLGANGRVVDGVLEVAEGRLAPQLFVRYLGITFGHIVLGGTHEILREHRMHEHAHVRQYERWGALFFMLYAGSSLWHWLRGGRPYWDNIFEREARAVAAGKPTAELR